jgi:hypothetical protein
VCGYIGLNSDSELLHGMEFSFIEGNANRGPLSSLGLADFRSYVCIVAFCVSRSFQDIGLHSKITLMLYSQYSDVARDRFVTVKVLYFTLICIAVESSQQWGTVYSILLYRVMMHCLSCQYLTKNVMICIMYQCTIRCPSICDFHIMCLG